MPNVLSVHDTHRQLMLKSVQLAHVHYEVHAVRDKTFEMLGGFPYL